MRLVIARHARSYEREEMIFNPLHYLALLEQKPARWIKRPRCKTGHCQRSLDELRRQMKPGSRNAALFVQVVLRLLETFSMAEVTPSSRHSRFPPSPSMRCKTSAVVRHRATSAEADLENYPHLPAAEVALTRAADYQVVLLEATVNDTPQVLLEHYLKQLRLPTMVREYPKLAEQCAERSCHLRTVPAAPGRVGDADRERRSTERRIKSARFSVTKSLRPTTSWHFRSSTRSWWWSWRAANDHQARQRAGLGQLRAQARPTSPWP